MKNNQKLDTDAYTPPCLEEYSKMLGSTLSEKSIQRNDGVKHEPKRKSDQNTDPSLDNEVVQKKIKMEFKDEPEEVLDMNGSIEHDFTSGPLAVSTPRQTKMKPPESPHFVDMFSHESHAPSNDKTVPPTPSPNPVMNVQRSSFGFGDNQEMCNLSMPVAAYINGNRPVKLHLPFDQMRHNISEPSDPDSPTIVSNFPCFTFFIRLIFRTLLNLLKDLFKWPKTRAPVIHIMIGLWVIRKMIAEIGMIKLFGNNLRIMISRVHSNVRLLLLLVLLILL